MLALARAGLTRAGVVRVGSARVCSGADWRAAQVAWVAVGGWRRRAHARACATADAALPDLQREAFAALTLPECCVCGARCRSLAHLTFWRLGFTPPESHALLKLPTLPGLVMVANAPPQAPGRAPGSLGLGFGRAAMASFALGSAALGSAALVAPFFWVWPLAAWDFCACDFCADGFVGAGFAACRAWGTRFWAGPGAAALISAGACGLSYRLAWRLACRLGSLHARGCGADWWVSGSRRGGGSPRGCARPGLR